MYIKYLHGLLHHIVVISPIIIIITPNYTSMAPQAHVLGNFDMTNEKSTDT